jgi:hypothetical protein
MRSSGRILNFGRPDHLVPKVRAQILGCPKVNATPSEQGGKVSLDAGEREQPRGRRRLEFDEQVYVAIGCERRSRTAEY